MYLYYHQDCLLYAKCIIDGFGQGNRLKKSTIWAEMDEIYDFQVIFYSIKNKQITLFPHIQAKKLRDCIFCITNWMNFHTHVIVQSVIFCDPTDRFQPGVKRKHGFDQTKFQRQQYQAKMAADEKNFNPRLAMSREFGVDYKTTF